MKTETEKILDNLLGCPLGVNGEVYYNTPIVTAKIMELYTENKRLHEENAYLRKFVDKLVK